jgi:hypothetical protein
MQYVYAKQLSAEHSERRKRTTENYMWRKDTATPAYSATSPTYFWDGTVQPISLGVTSKFELKFNVSIHSTLKSTRSMTFTCLFLLLSFIRNEDENSELLIIIPLNIQRKHDI